MKDRTDNNIRLSGGIYMYWTLRKGNREIRVHSKFRVRLLQILGWRKTFRFEGSE